MEFRAAHSCDKIGNNLYIFGGWNGKKALNNLKVIDLDKLLSSPAVDNSSSMPQPEASTTDDAQQTETFGPTPSCRNNHATAVYGEKIYIHGGHDGVKWVDDLYVLNTSSLVWTIPKINGEKPTARACHTLSRVGKKLYMFGGFDGEKCFNEIDVLDLEILTW